jgi:hypothetical protein
MHRILTIARLTWKSAFRYRIFWVLALILVGAVVGLPLILKDDGTAKGLTQIVLTYTLSIVTVLLGVATLWLSCGTLARDVEDCQMQMVATKPIARWQIWLGKWVGILGMNAMLLALSGVTICLLLQWRAQRLPAEEQQVLHNEIFVARASAKERPPDLGKVIEAEANDWRKKNPNAKPTEDERLVLETQFVGKARAMVEEVDPGYGKIWAINLSKLSPKALAQPMQMRIKFRTSNPDSAAQSEKTYSMVWFVGPPSSQNPSVLQEAYPPGSFQEVPLPPLIQPLLDDKGILYVQCLNRDVEQLFFPIEDGFEVLYHENSFGVNFARGMAVILCWLALLSAMGLASASFLSFPVAAFVSLAMLMVGLSTGTLSEVQTEKSIFLGTGSDANAATKVIDSVTVPIFDAVLGVVNLVEGFSPVDALSTGHSITWKELGSAVEQIVLLLGGFFALVGILLFNRRELAAVQVNT